MSRSFLFRNRLAGFVCLCCIVTAAIFSGCDNSGTTDDPITDNTGVTKDDLLSELNTVRTNPKLYATYLEALRSYYKGNRFEEPGEIPVITQEGVAALNDAINHLKSMTPVGALAWADGLAKAAADHVKDTGPKGLLGHTGSDGSSMSDRVERYGTWNITIGENISYGATTARRIMIQLLVDDGVSDRGHRKNMVNPVYRFVGMSVGPHKEYSVMCVQDFAAEYVSTMPRAHSSDAAPIQ